MTKLVQNNHPPMKRCRDCGIEKPTAEFTKNSKNADGLGTYCRACFAVRDRASRERRAAREGRAIGRRRQVPDGYRFCPACESLKPLDEFPRNKSARSGRGGYCKPCHNAIGKATYTRLYGGTREYHLRRRYGLTSADVDAMIEAQGGTCAVCSGKPEHVDHDHKTDQVRGILCFNCNQALGNVRDDVDVLEGLIGYLLSHQPPELEDRLRELVEAHRIVYEIGDSRWHAA